MSLLLSRLSKQSSLKTTHAVVVSFSCLLSNGKARSFSSSILENSFPCIIAGARHCGSTWRDGEIGNLKICKEISLMSGIHERYIVTEKKVPMKLVEEMGTVGASKGWVATMKEGVMCLQDDLNPRASDIDPKRIYLPPLVTLPHCQTQVVTNMAMSSSCPEDDDCVVAIKFLGPQLSLCRPARSSEWTNIRMTDAGFFNSRVMYSMRDEMFNMPVSTGAYIGSWNIGEHQMIHQLRYQDFPEMLQYKWQRLDSCYRTEHLVESRPTGETFLVKWYIKRECRIDGRVGMKVGTQRFMVFKIDEEGNAKFTSDIGDLCIFLSEAEPFCVQASLCHETPNWIFFLGPDNQGVMSPDPRASRPYFNTSTYPVPYYIH